MTPRSINKLELHYFFSDDSHTLDAVIRNECEKELLALFYECASILDVNLNIESEAFSEGGLREFWNFLGTPQIPTIVAILALVLSCYPPKTNKNDEQLKELQLEETKLHIKKLRLELKALEVGTVNRRDVKEIAKKVAKSSRIIIRRSNFYEKLIQSPKVRSLTYAQVNQDYEHVDEELKVKRKKFKDFIIHSKKLQPITTNDAEIEIIAPVLKEGKYKWRGAYQNQSLSFSMADKVFKQQVLGKEVSFQNGTTIIAVLETHRKLDAVGEVVITGFSVATVLNVHDESQQFNTPQGLEYIQARELSESQGDLFIEAS